MVPLSDRASPRWLTQGAASYQGAFWRIRNREWLGRLWFLARDHEKGAHLCTNADRSHIPLRDTPWSICSRVFYSTVEAPRNEAAQHSEYLPQVLRLHARMARLVVGSNSTMGMFWGRHRFLAVTRLRRKLAKNLGLKHSPTSKWPISLG